MSKENNEHVEFSNKELQDKYEVAKKISDEHLKRLNLISMDIRRLEKFLQESGFGEFNKRYTVLTEVYHLFFDGKRLRMNGMNLIETKVKERLEAHPFLPDFLESIALHHTPKGKEEANHESS